MRIYAAGDLHGRAGRLSLIRLNIDRHHPDVLVAAGDIINYRQPERTLEKLNGLPVPVLAVRGNSDPRRMEGLFGNYPNITPLHMRRHEIQTIPFAGLSGTIPLPFRNRIAIREKSLVDQLLPLVGRQTVLVTHSPPWGATDRVMSRFHSGSKRVRDLVIQAHPRLLICGHIHEAAGVDRLGETVVVNCSMSANCGGFLIDLNRDDPPVVNRLSP